MLIYDCEIIKAIDKTKTAGTHNGIEYCDGWRDFENMGISVICAFDYATDRYRVFMQDNMDDFKQLVEDHETIIGFNSIAFDNKLCAANGITISEAKSFDVLVEIWKAAGLAPEFNYPSHAGYGLEDVCMVNFGVRKSGNGALAPVHWQTGKVGKVVDYCLNDVKLTKMVVDKMISTGKLTNPNNPTETLWVRSP